MSVISTVEQKSSKELLDKSLQEKSWKKTLILNQKQPQNGPTKDVKPTICKSANPAVLSRVKDFLNKAGNEVNIACENKDPISLDEAEENIESPLHGVEMDIMFVNDLQQTQFKDLLENSSDSSDAES